MQVTENKNQTPSVSFNEFSKGIEKFNNVIRGVVEMFLTEDEKIEINNPKTSKRRIKELIEISNKRMMSNSIENIKKYHL